MRELRDGFLVPLDTLAGPVRHHEMAVLELKGFAKYQILRRCLRCVAKGRSGRV